MSAEYSIDTLAEMAAIPVEALPRFLAELPVILAEARNYAAMQAAMQAMIGQDVEIVAAGAIWLDDGANTFGVTISTTEGEQLFAASAKRGA